MPPVARATAVKGTGRTNVAHLRRSTGAFGGRGENEAPPNVARSRSVRTLSAL